MTESAEAPVARVQRSHNRLQALLDASAKLFATKGYKATTMRDIASESGMKAGSLYYHFKSKQDLLLAVYQQAVSGMQSQLEALQDQDLDPWTRFEQAVTVHISTILDQTNYAKVMVGVVPDDAPEIAAELTHLRDGYEQTFTEIIKDIPLPRGTDRKLLRLMVLGAANATQLWYQPGKKSPESIARTFVRFLREAME